jgi:exodeoxyribonuclease-3
MTFKIATWNVNSVKSRLTHLVSWLKSASPDVLLLQELKCITDNFPFMEVEDLGYNVAVLGQKTYNGVAILSKHPIDEVIEGLPNFEDLGDVKQARYVEAVISVGGAAVRVASIYVPNGQEAGSDKFAYKMRFFDALQKHVAEILTYDEIVIFGGDYNVAPNEIDVYDPVNMAGSICFHIDERKKFRSLLNSGLVDAYRAMHPQKQQFSWWDYRAGAFNYNKGMRIDHLLLSPQAADLLVASDVDAEPRAWEKPSDHTPVICELSVN